MKRNFLYALPAIPLALMGLPFYVVLPSFYAQNTLATLTAISIALFAARIFDLLSDPAAGWLSDHWPGGPSRVKPMIIGTPILILGTWFVFQPPQDATAYYLLTWTLISYIGWTLIMVPYQTWAADLGSLDHERNQLNASREFGTLIGTILSMVLIGMYTSDLSTGLSVMALVLAVSLPLFVLSSSRLKSDYNNPQNLFKFSQLPNLFSRYPDLKKLVIAYGINALANGIPATLFLLFVTHKLQMEDKAPLFLGIYFLFGLLSVPAWVSISNGLGKKNTWLISMSVASISFLAVLLLEPGSLIGFLIVCIVTGICLGADLFLPASMQSDYARQLEESENLALNGLMFGIWGIATKSALALSVLFTFIPLDVAGFDAKSTNDEQALMTLTLLYGLVPVALKIIAIERVSKTHEQLIPNKDFS